MLCWFQLCQGDCAFASILLLVHLSVSIIAQMVMRLWVDSHETVGRGGLGTVLRMQALLMSLKGTLNSKVFFNNSKKELQEVYFCDVQCGAVDAIKS